MDGTLIDSEPLWEIAEQEGFKKSGLKLSVEKQKETKGLSTIDAVKFWLKDQKFTNSTHEAIAADINRIAEDLIISRGKLMPGVIDVLNDLKEKGLPIAIASSSSIKIIEDVVLSHKLEFYFDILHSGDNERVGKPHPGIFISTADRLNVDPAYCVVFEDSVNGIKAAKSAGMKVVAFICDHLNDHYKFDMADMKLESFHNFGSSEYEQLELLMKNH